MVAPLVIAGLAGLAGLAAGAGVKALRRKVLYALVWIRGNGVVGKTFPDQASAEQAQDQLAAKGRSTILIKKDGRELSALRAVAGGGRKVDPKALRGMGVGARDIDSTEVMEEQLEITTDHPESAASRQARLGPYPDTDPGTEGRLKPIEPLFRETTSSHEWKTDVDTFQVPEKFFPGHDAPGAQPDELVVEQALQYPVEDEAVSKDL